MGCLDDNVDAMMLNLKWHLGFKITSALVVFGAITCAAVLMCGQAKADPALEHDKAIVCRLIDTDPSEHGVAIAIKGMMLQNFSPEQIGNTLGLAVRDFCPEYQSVMVTTIRDWSAAGGRKEDIDKLLQPTTMSKGMVA